MTMGKMKAGKFRIERSGVKTFGIGMIPSDTVDWVLEGVSTKSCHCQTRKLAFFLHDIGLVAHPCICSIGTIRISKRVARATPRGLRDGISTTVRFHRHGRSVCLSYAIRYGRSVLSLSILCLTSCPSHRSTARA